MTLFILGVLLWSFIGCLLVGSSTEATTPALTDLVLYGLFLIGALVAILLYLIWNIKVDDVLVILYVIPLWRMRRKLGGDERGKKKSLSGLF